VAAYLIDTNVISELRKGARCHAAVTSWLQGVPDGSLYTSVLVIGELRRGIESIRLRDPAAAKALETWLATVIRQHGERILGVDRAVAEEWGRLSVPDPLPVIDGLLAATALVHGLTLVTRNVKDVARTGVSVLDPFGACGPSR
jgi:predicted nucleic acid-binding protein